MANVINTIKHATKTVIIAALFVVALGFLQAAYTGPTAVPPSQNRDIPINLSSSFQDKDGEIRADTIDVVSSICLNAGTVPATDCRSSWPTASGSVSCQLQVRRVTRSTGAHHFFTDPGLLQSIYPNKYPKCSDYLTSQALAAGWQATGGDNVTVDGNGNPVWPSVCVYTRVYCSGAGLTLSQPTETFSTYSGPSYTIPLNSPPL
jgi:hypothetical protein